jgi:acetyl-CoA decarbonylase/synthase complex subunit gamma
MNQANGGPQPDARPPADGRTYVTGWIETAPGPVPVVSTTLDWSDRWGAARVMLGAGRMNYRVEPGLYAVGGPSAESPVMVTANYKLSFDALRSSLNALDAWILVLDTRGINVWCAAGKGTFGAAEIVNRIVRSGLRRVVSHRTLIVPQLGATGVAAHEVYDLSTFGVIFGPVRARDIPAFLEAGMKATLEMRRVRFTLLDRLKLIPVEITQRAYIAILVMVVAFLLAGISRSGYSPVRAVANGSRAVLNLGIIYLAANALGPALLPWIPGRSFSLKGLLLGLVLFLASVGAGLTGSELETVSWTFLYAATASFIVMNFTGSTTYTSLSGVKKEMKLALPLQIASAIIGAVLWMAARLI